MAQTQFKPVLWRFFKIYLPMAALAAAAAFIVGHFRVSWHFQDLQSRQRAFVSLEKGLMDSSIRAHKADAVLLAEMLAGSFSSEGPFETASKAAEPILSFMKHRNAYDRIRFMGKNGGELVGVQRAKGGLHLMPKGGLKPKGDSGCFKEAMGLEPGEVYLSRFDLDRNNGRLEKPFKPMLRFASPVDGPKGRMGVVVLYCKGGILLDRLRGSASARKAGVYLINDNGYWLLGPSPDMEWGFMLKGGGQNKMASVFPRSWEAIGRGLKGQFVNQEGLFTYDAITAGGKGGAQKGGKPRKWTLIAHIQPEKLDPAFMVELRIWLSALLALMGVLVWLFAQVKYRKALAEDQLAENRERIKAMSDAAQDAMVVVDSDDKVLFWNKAAEKMFGHEAGAALGSALHRLVAPPDQRTKAAAGYRGFSKDGRGDVVGHVVVVDGIRADGQSFPAEVAVSSFNLKGRWHAVGSIRDITERKRLEDELRRLATTDPLTGVYNRRRFMERAAEEFDICRRYEKLDMAVMIMDIDHFKDVNDTYGHEGGDLALKAVAAEALAHLRSTDVFGRLGGEEFGLALPNTDGQMAMKAAERLRRALGNLQITTRGGLVAITVSLGIAVMEPQDSGVGEMLRRADRALYQAKQNGRNRSEMF